MAGGRVVPHRLPNHIAPEVRLRSRVAPLPRALSLLPSRCTSMSLSVLPAPCFFLLTVGFIVSFVPFYRPPLRHTGSHAGDKVLVRCLHVQTTLRECIASVGTQFFSYAMT